MKRVKAACILQTLVFAQKEDCGLTREQQLRLNRDEVSCYKARWTGAVPVSDYRGNRAERRFCDRPCAQAVQRPRRCERIF